MLLLSLIINICCHTFKTKSFPPLSVIKVVEPPSFICNPFDPFVPILLELSVAELKIKQVEPVTLTGLIQAERLKTPNNGNDIAELSKIKSSLPSKDNERVFVNDDPAGIAGTALVPAPLNIDGVNV